MSWGGAFDSLFCPELRVLYTMIVLGEGFVLFESFPGGLSKVGLFWMKLIAALGT